MYGYFRNDGLFCPQKPCLQLYPPQRMAGCHCFWLHLEDSCKKLSFDLVAFKVCISPTACSMLSCEVCTAISTTTKRNAKLLYKLKDVSQLRFRGYRSRNFSEGTERFLLGVDNESKKVLSNCCINHQLIIGLNHLHIVENSRAANQIHSGGSQTGTELRTKCMGSS